eukprot:gene5169-5688_t
MDSNTCHVHLEFSDFHFHQILKSSHSLDVDHQSEDDQEQEEETENKKRVSVLPCWLSWSLFSQPFQSDTFLSSNQSSSLPKVIIQDDFDIDYLYRHDRLRYYLPTEIQSSFPLKIFLCSEEKILAMATFDPFPALVGSTAGGAGLHMPLTYACRVHFTPVEDDHEVVILAEMVVSIEIVADEPPPPPPPSGTTTAPPDTTEVVPHPLPLPLPSPPKDQCYHYRLTIDLRSISGLIRPFQGLVMSYQYPYLGHPQPFRSKRSSYLTQQEQPIPRGSMIYDFVMSNEQLEEVLRGHPIVHVSLIEETIVLSKRLLGSIDIPLAQLILQHDNHEVFYRSVLSQKTYDSKEDCLLADEVLRARSGSGNSGGKRSSNIPVTIYVADHYYPCQPHSEERKGEDLIEEEGGGDSRSNPLRNAKIRAVITLEEIATVAAETGVPVLPGYKMHRGALYASDYPTPIDPMEGGGGGRSPALDDLLWRQEWESWRQAAEAQWREALIEKEQQLKVKLQKEQTELTAKMVDDLTRAQQEVARLEIKLKASLDEVQRQKMNLSLQEEQMKLRMITKTEALQVTHQRLKKEHELTLRLEQQKNHALEEEVRQLTEALQRADKRRELIEQEKEDLKRHYRQAPETALQQEIVRLQTHLSEMKIQVEQAKKETAEMKLDREHWRSQVYRLATALKREREKMSYIARQEVEQLRLEFLAREERFQLDGDRDVLQSIRQELNFLKTSGV